MNQVKDKKMNTCNKHPDIVYIAYECPLCVKQKEIDLKNNQINRLLEFRENYVNRQTLCFEDICIVLGKSKPTLYKWHSTKYPYPDFPWELNGRELTTTKSKLIDWAKLNNVPLYFDRLLRKEKEASNA